MIDETPKLFGPIDDKEMIVIEKKWGKEYIIPGQDGYTTKFMSVAPGGTCSVHFHKFKNETFVLLRGKLLATYFTQDGNKVETLLSNPLDSLVLPNCTPHTFKIPADQEEDTWFLESSTTDHPNDSYRLTRSTSNEKEDTSNR
jgi:mannose-6-phosphate isomerase-like protein (cupin superfamily)